MEYVNVSTKVCVICPIHGEFWIKPNDHLSKRGCKKCFIDSLKYNKEIFVKKAKEIHGDKYDYSKVEYVSSKIKVCVICPIHGEFWLTPKSHMQKTGCPFCKESHLEKEMCNILNKNNIIFERQKRFDWLGLQSLDFFLPKYNIAIECQGRQHFIDETFINNTKETLKIRQERDMRKKQLCEKHNVKLLYYSNLGIDYPYEVIENENLLILKIQEKNGDTKNISVNKC